MIPFDKSGLGVELNEELAKKQFIQEQNFILKWLKYKL